MRLTQYMWVLRAIWSFGVIFSTFARAIFVLKLYRAAQKFAVATYIHGRCSSLVSARRLRELSNVMARHDAQSVPIVFHQLPLQIGRCLICAIHSLSFLAVCIAAILLIKWVSSKLLLIPDLLKLLLIFADLLADLVVITFGDSLDDRACARSRGLQLVSCIWWQTLLLRNHHLFFIFVIHQDQIIAIFIISFFFKCLGFLVFFITLNRGIFRFKVVLSLHRSVLFLQWAKHGIIPVGRKVGFRALNTILRITQRCAFFFDSFSNRFYHSLLGHVSVLYIWRLRVSSRISSSDNERLP